MRRGKLVCVLGIDGSGKTTLTSSLKSRLEAGGRKTAYVWCGWRSFESLPGRAMKKLLRRSDRRAAATTGRGSSRAIYPFAIVDYLLNTLPRLRRELRRNEFIVSDRYVYDVTAAFVAAAGTRPTRKYTFFHRFYPTPDHLFYIDVPADVAMARKEDVPSRDYLLALQDVYRQVLPRERVTVLDGTQPPAVLLAIIYEKVTQ